MIDTGVLGATGAKGERGEDQTKGAGKTGTHGAELDSRVAPGAQGESATTSAQAAGLVPPAAPHERFF